jgi:magnesium transporter
MIRAMGLTAEGNPVTAQGIAGVTQLWQKRGSFMWVDFEMPSMEEVEFLAVSAGFHPLAIEDCVTFNGFPKIDDYQSYLYMVIQTITVQPNTEEERFKLEEIDFFLGTDYLITYRSALCKPVDSLWERMGALTELYSRGPDMLMHMVIDKVVEKTLPEVENFEVSIEDLEERVINRSSHAELEEIFKYKRELSILNRMVLPQRDVIGRLGRGEFALIKSSSLPFFRDIYDDLNRILLITDNLRNTLNSLMEAYLSSINNRMNQVMKVLTVFASIMLPLTVITGMFGMNFRIIPFSDEPFGFWGIFGLMALLSIGMLMYFRKKGWF